MKVTIKYDGDAMERQMAEEDGKADHETIDIRDSVLEKAVKHEIITYEGGEVKQIKVVGWLNELKMRSDLQCVTHTDVFRKSEDSIGARWKYYNYGKVLETIEEMVEIAEKKDAHMQEIRRRIEQKERIKKNAELKEIEEKKRLTDKIEELQKTIEKMRKSMKNTRKQKGEQ